MNERSIDMPRVHAALVERGLEDGEAANLAGYLVGLPSMGLRWTIAEVEAIQRLRHERDGRRIADDRTALPDVTPETT